MKTIRARGHQPPRDLPVGDHEVSVRPGQLHVLTDEQAEQLEAWLLEHGLASCYLLTAVADAVGKPVETATEPRPPAPDLWKDPRPGKLDPEVVEQLKATPEVEDLDEIESRRLELEQLARHLADEDWPEQHTMAELAQHVREWGLDVPEHVRRVRSRRELLQGLQGLVQAELEGLED